MAKRLRTLQPAVDGTTHRVTPQTRTAAGMSKAELGGLVRAGGAELRNGPCGAGSGDCRRQEVVFALRAGRSLCWELDSDHTAWATFD